MAFGNCVLQPDDGLMFMQEKVLFYEMHAESLVAKGQATYFQIVRQTI